MLDKALVKRMSRKTHAVREIFKKNLLDEKITLRGWVYRRRSHGNLVFILLRDSTGVIQCSVHRDQVDEKTWEEAERATIESAIVVEGVTTHDKRAPGNIELRTHFVDVISFAEPFPIKKDAGKTYLLDNRHLFLRSPKVVSVLKIRAKVCKAAREYLEEEGYVEVHTPSFVTAAVEGGATLFPVNYFGKTAYLTQSGQFYEEAAISGLEKVYCLQPSFRAEKSRTRRHITEYWHLECEVAFSTHEEIMELEENLVAHICKRVVEENQDELETIGREFKPPTPPYPRITYKEAVELLQKNGIEIEPGDDFGSEAERFLSMKHSKPFFVTGYPVSARAFYHMPDPDNPKYTLSSDMMAPEGYGELTSGGQRIHDAEQLIQRIRECNLDPKEYSWYLDLRRYGTPPHAGFGLGIERLVSWICGLDHIRDACLFPRTPSRLTP